jgi:hypothetical protein
MKILQRKGRRGILDRGQVDAGTCIFDLVIYVGREICLTLVQPNYWC